MTATTITILHVAHKMYDRNEIEILFEVKGNTVGLKYNISKAEDEKQFQLIGWLAEVRFYETELIGKTLRALITDTESGIEIKAIGNKLHDSFFIVNGDGELQSEHRCRMELQGKK